ncbi:MAG: GNAT family N-acetyltransferase [Anaerolineae bacterium]|nr:GNAT family N-acetyltransferase [Anaerolineae bacterium]
MVANQGDYVQIGDLLQTANRLVLRISRADVQTAITQHPFFMVKRACQVGCACGVFIEPESVAQIRVLALHDAWLVMETMTALLPYVVDELKAKGAETLAFLGTEEWLIDGLLNHHFDLENTIITLQKMTFDTPDRGNTEASVRPAIEADFTAILGIDRAAFEPLWHHTATMLAQVSQEAVQFAVAELKGRVVGYVYSNLTGRHGHISRIAVDPAYQGCGIGVRLLNETIQFFERKRAFGITLNTQQDNERSRRLYEWFGFELLGDEAYLLTRSL